MFDPFTLGAGIYAAHKIAVTATSVGIALVSAAIYSLYRANQSNVTDMHAISVYDPRYIEYKNSRKVADPV